MVRCRTVVKYFIFIPNSLGAILGAGSVVAGYIISLLLEYILVIDLPFLGFLREIPGLLMTCGAILFTITFLGSSGAVLPGKVGKWLIRAHMATLSIFVILYIYVLVALHLSHRSQTDSINSSGRLRRAIALTGDQLKAEQYVYNLSYDYNRNNYEKETLQFQSGKHDTKLTATNSLIDNGDRIETNIKTPYIGNNTRISGDEIPSANWKRTSGSNQEYTNKMFGIDRLEVKENDKKEMFSQLNKVKDSINLAKLDPAKNSSIVNKMKNIKIRKARDAFLSDAAAQIIARVKNAVGTFFKLKLLITKTLSFIVDIFVQLSDAEMERVKWVRPIMGKLTGPAFRLSAYPLVMNLAIYGLVLEICFIFLVVYFSTAQKPGSAQPFHEHITRFSRNLRQAHSRIRSALPI